MIAERLPVYARSAFAFARAELGAVAALGVLAAGAAAFVNVAEEVTEGDTEAIDRAVLQALRTPGLPSDPIGPHWLEVAARDVTSLGSVAVLVGVALIVIGFVLVQRRAGAALLVAAALGGGTALSNAIKALVGRPRPEMDYRAVEAGLASFPSGHAMLSAITYLTMGVLLARALPNRRLKAYVLAVALVLTLLIGLSRIYLGVHWLTDVLAGWSLGAAWAMVCWLLAWRLERRAAARGERVLASEEEPVTRPAPMGE